MKVAIVGGRNYPLLDQVRYVLQSLVNNRDITEVISGGARGVDRTAADEARRLGIKVTEFLPDYTRFGRRAPKLRNVQIADAADEMIAFWDKESPGTAHAIAYMTYLERPVMVYSTGDQLEFKEDDERQLSILDYLRDTDK